MFDKLFVGICALSLVTSLTFGAQGVKFFIGNGDKEEAFMDMVNNQISTIGFVLTDSHGRINDAYKAKWGG